MILILGFLIPLSGAVDEVPQVRAADHDGNWCNGPDVMTVLVLGTDHKTRSYQYGLSDVIMVYRIDFKTPEVTAISIPRGLWVEIPGLEERVGASHGILNMAYLYGTPDMGYQGEREEAAELFRRTLEENWGLTTDRAAVMNMTVFKDVVSAIGGIKVVNPSPVYSFHQKNKPKFPAGAYFFDGKEAQLYARWRDPRNTLDRLDRHSILVKAVINSLFDLETVPHIPELLSAFRDNVVTDLNLAQLSQMLCLASKRDQVEVTFTRIPKDALMERRTYFSPLDTYISNQVEKEEGRIEEILSAFQAGQWPPENGE